MAVTAALPMLALGLLLTVKGGDLFVAAAVALARGLGVPAFLVGATVLSLATTLPELAVSLLAAGRGADGIAAGNAVGSVNANLGLILGLGLCLAPGALEGRQRAPLLLMAGAAGLLAALCAGGTLDGGGALLLIALGVFHLAGSAASARRHARRQPPGNRPPAWALASRALALAAGAAAIAAGARLLCDYGAALARLCGVPEGVIGATLVAAGTSLPELAAALAALRRGEAGLSVGNVVGANLIDLTLILPLCALERGGSLPLPPQTLAVDLPACLALAALAAGPALASGRFRRWQGALLLAGYGAYAGVVALSR